MEMPDINQDRNVIVKYYEGFKDNIKTEEISVLALWFLVGLPEVELISWSYSEE